MNYTENYHLPQWVKTDRIMMEDFNQMCEDLEAGLTENRNAAESFRQNGSAQDERLLKQLLRLAYNQYLAAQAMDPFPNQIGVFYQNALRDLTYDEGASWDGARLTANAPGSVIQETFFSQCVKTRSNLLLDKDNPANSKPLEVEICTPSPTRLENFTLSGSLSGYVRGTPALFLLTINNLDTGEVEQSMQLDLTEIIAPDGLGSNVQKGVFNFHGGARYLLRIEPIGDPVFSSNIHFSSCRDTQVLGSGIKREALNVSHTIRDPEGSSLGLLFLRCKAGGPTGKLTVQWDGRTVEPVSVRPCRNEQGLVLREMIYVRREPIPAETTFSLNFTCGTNGSIWFQDWGAILL